MADDRSKESRPGEQSEQPPVTTPEPGERGAAGASEAGAGPRPPTEDRGKWLDALISRLADDQSREAVAPLLQDTAAPGAASADVAELSDISEIDEIQPDDFQEDDAGAPRSATPPPTPCDQPTPRDQEPLHAQEGAPPFTVDVELELAPPGAPAGAAPPAEHDPASASASASGAAAAPARHEAAQEPGVSVDSATWRPEERAPIDAPGADSPSTFAATAAAAAAATAATAAPEDQEPSLDAIDRERVLTPAFSTWHGTPTDPMAAMSADNAPSAVPPVAPTGTARAAATSEDAGQALEIEPADAAEIEPADALEIEPAELQTAEIEPHVTPPPPTPRDSAPSLEISTPAARQAPQALPLEEEPEQALPAPLEEALARATEDNPERMELALNHELDAEEDPGRKAIIQHELGHLLHSRMTSEARAVKAYAQALNLDPLLRPNIWAIRRIFISRQLWPNLLKLHDAEVRFEEDPHRKAEILLEKGWLLLDKLSDQGGARECFQQAHAAHPQWLAPLLALEKLTLVEGDIATLADVYRRVAEVSEDPARRVAALVDLARLQEKLAHGSAEQALRILEEAYKLDVDRRGVLQEMEQVAATANLVQELPGILRRQASHLVVSDPPDRGAAAARLRLAAQIARDALADLALAQELLAAALDLQPEERLLQRDLMALAEERGDHTLVETILAGQLERTQDAPQRAALEFRIGVARRAAGRDGADALRRSLEALPGYLPAFVDQERQLLQQGQLQALAELYLAEAAAVEQRSAGSPLNDADPVWCASALWRAATIFHWRLGRPDQAIELCERAVKLAPQFEPALDELEVLLEHAGRHGALATLLDERLAAGEVDRAPFLLESLASLAGGTLDDPEREVGYLRRLLELRPDDVRLHRRLAHALERLGRFAELEVTLRSLEKIEPHEPQQTFWKLSRAQLYEGPLQRADDAVATYREVLGASSGHAFAFAFTALDSLLRREGKWAELAALLRLAADQAAPDVEGQGRKQTLLRQLSGLYARRLARPGKAIETCAELLGLVPGDLAALRDLARYAGAAGDPARAAQALEGLAAASGDPATKARLHIRLAEILEDRLSDVQRAEEEMAKAVSIAPDRAAVVDAEEVLARRLIARGDLVEAAAHLAQLQTAAPAEAVPLVLEERAWLASAGERHEGQEGIQLWSQLRAVDPQNRRALFAQNRVAARQRDPVGVSEAMAQLETLATDPSLAATLALRAGVLLDAASSPPAEHTAADAYRRVLQREPGNIEALLGMLAQPKLSAEDNAELLERLAGVAPDRVREETRLPLAEAYERGGRFADAISELAPLLDKDPEHLPALLVLQRIAEASGDRCQEAALLVRIAQLTSDRAAKAEGFARAAQLLQQQQQQQQQEERSAEAAILLRHVLALRPADRQCFDELRRFYEATNDHKGLDEILGHRLRHTSESGVLIALHFERAELRLQKLGDKQGAVRDLLRILKLDPRHLEAMRKLALLYDEDGNVERALDLYRRYAASADALSVRRPIVLRVAELYHDKQARTAEAIEVLRRFLEESPDDQAVLERLADLYVQVRDVPHAVGTLERLGDLREDRRWRASNLQRIGSLYWKDLKDPQEARATLLRARDMDPINLGVIRDLRQLLRQLGLADDLTLLFDRAKDDLREALAAEPISIELYRKLMQVAEWNEDEHTLLASMGVLCFLNAADLQDRDLYRRRIAKVTFEPKQQLGAQAWREALVESGAKNAYGEIWAVIADCVPKLYEERVPGDVAVFGASRSDRVDRKLGGPVSNTLDRIAGAFGLGDFDIYMSSAKPHVVAGVAGERSAVVVGHSVVTGLDASRRFQVGRTMSLLRDRAFALEILSQDELELLFSAAIFTAEPGASFALPRAQVDSESRRLVRVLPRKARRTLPLAVARFMQEGGDLRAWIDGVLATASRAGLLVCGDILAAMEQLVPELRQTGARSEKSPDELADLVRHTPQAAQLLVYSVGGTYLRLRQELAL